MTEIHFHLGARAGEGLPEVLARSTRLPAWAPFDPRAVAFVGRFSQRLLRSPRVRQFPEFAALAHWFRAAGLKDLARRYPGNTPEALVLGRGLAFHLAPANVDSVFMYSWLISLLAGNTNIVRVSQKLSLQLEFLIDVLHETLREDVGVEVAGRVVLLTYAHDEAVTRALSQACMLRVVWGGDATVATIRAIALRPTAAELCFPDRFSAAAIKADAVLSASEQVLHGLARGFYNDAFWFAQQACSSPRMLLWVGADEVAAAARLRFWSAVDEQVRSHQPENTEAMSMARLAASFEYAAAELAHPDDPAALSRFPQRLTLERGISTAVKDLHCGNGLFLEQTLGTLEALAAQLSDKEQTLAAFGFQRPELEALVAALPARAIDRIVPFGEALAFAPVWDGQDLFVSMTRRITIAGAAA